MAKAGDATLSGDQFAHRLERPVDWGHIDSNQHLNNVALLRFVESARVDYFIRTCGDALKPPSGGILAEISCKYIRPVFYPDELIIYHRCHSIGTTSLTLEYIVDSNAQGRVAQGQARIVFYDYGKKAKAPVPPAVVDRVLAAEKDPSRLRPSGARL